LETLPAHRALRGAGTILIRDASARSARVYAGICHLAGYDVVLCRPDEVNTQHPREYRVDLAIIGVSEATGPRPALWHASATVPAILVSGTPSDACRAVELGYQAVLMRPVVPSALRDTIRRVLAEHRSQEVARASRMDEASPDHRRAMQEIAQEEYAVVRAMSHQLRDQSRRLCRYAQDLRRRAIPGASQLVRMKSLAAR
jgi:DNA-binding NtrC family response regulator